MGTSGGSSTRVEDLRAGDDLGTRQDELDAFLTDLTGSAADTLTATCGNKGFVLTPSG